MVSTMTSVEPVKIPEGYKQTEVGVVPEDWVITRVGSVAHVVDSLHQTPVFSVDGYAMVRVADIKSGNLNLKTTLKVAEGVFNDFTRNYKPKKNDIVLSRVGSYGVSSFVSTEEDFCIGQNTVVINSKITPKYLYYMLNSDATWQQIEDGSYGSGYKSLSLKNINQLIIPVPEEKEQTAIANALSDVDNLIASLETLIAKKSAIKTAAMQQLLTGKKRLPSFEKQGAKQSGDHPAGSRSMGEASQIKDTNQTAPRPGYKQTELGEIPEDWEVKAFGEICNVNQGLQIAIDNRNKNPSEKSKVYITVQFLNSDNAPEYIDDYTAPVCCDENDILMTRTGNTGMVVTGAEGVFHNNFFKINFDRNKLYSKYFVTYLRSHSCQKTILDKAGTSTIPDLNHHDFYSIKIALPSFEEQRTIADVLSDMDTELDALKQRLNKTQKIKQGMMQELLTGKTRLLNVG